MKFHLVRLINRQKFFIGTGVAFLLTLLFLFSPLLVLFETLEFRAMDYKFLLRNRQSTSRVPILVVLLDDLSVNRFGFRSPLPRALMAEVVRNLNAKGARCIGLDFLLDRPHIEDQDALLEQALQQSKKKVVLVHPALERFAKHTVVGFSEITTDGSSVAREMTLSKPELQGVPAFVSALHDSCYGRKPEAPKESGETSVMINYYGPPSHLSDRSPTFNVVSALELTYLPTAAVRGKAVLVGSGLIDLGDTFLTAFSGSSSDFKVSFGVELHATVLGMFLQNRYLKPLSPWMRSGTFFLLVWGVALTTLFLRPATALGLWVIFSLGWAAFSVVAFAAGDWVVPFVYPLFMAGIVFGGCQFILYITEIRYSNFLRSTFNRYLAPEVVKELVENPHQIKLGGEFKKVTILFSDLENFTTFSEKNTPQTVVSLLSEFLGGMTEVIMEEKGTIGDFIGDSVMAYFGAPLELPDHEERCCRAGLVMQERIEFLNLNWKDQGLPHIKMRIGIHSGEVIVGNIGSEIQQKYGVVGDSVNLAARLEGVNKIFGTPIIISNDTFEPIRDLFFARELGRILVAGRSSPTTIFELLGENPSAGISPVNEEPYLECYRMGLERFYGQDFKRAGKYFREGSNELGDRAAAFMEQQCKFFSKRKLPGKWIGVIEIRKS